MPAPILDARDSIKTPEFGDIFTVSLIAGVEYTARVFGASTLGGTLPDPFIVLRDASGNDLDSAFDSLSRPDPFLRFTVEESGQYQIGVFSDDNGIGDYRVLVEEMEVLSPRLEVQGTIEVPGETDVFLVDLDPGTYDVAVLGQSTGGSLPDPVIRLFESEDDTNPLIDDDSLGDASNLDPLLGFDIFTAGTYLIEVADFGAGTGEYTLLLDERVALDIA